jgi:lysophospholipase L1-like esterase
VVNVLALGDSIIWGQGHTADSKFVTLVCAWLRARGHDALLTLVAHSGAVVSPTSNDDATPVWPEVPEPAPSIVSQLRTAAHANASANVDVLLIDGGINDVSAFNIVVADPFDPNALAALTTTTTRIFSGPVPQMLAEAVATFPRAKIVVTGYYPVISNQTAARALIQLIKHLPRPAGVPNTADLAIEHLPDELLEIAIAPERQRMIEQSAMFYRVSSQLLRAAVNSYQSTGRVFFADPGFVPANAFAAPETWLWSGANDPLFRERFERYAEHVLTMPFDWPLSTPLASVCHPNFDGAKAYAGAIQSCLVEAGL